MAHIGCPKNPINRRTLPEVPENAWADSAIIPKIKMPPTPAEEPNPSPVTQFIPGSVQLSSNANPSDPRSFLQADVSNNVQHDELVLQPNG
ncbi:hypothetical protein AVEN_63544-1 [Araneus ventricosus]|uniref:Uncharacterized protein n=1 Tax=Araneus ventricosus TaxID=182803 RepID=A0A4Y2X1Z5_ARAVE|nr:hypothetical protein AVEN_63544-1 [Araneus ventricosus]